MAAANKIPNYYAMTREELDVACNEQHQIILENRAWIRENKGTADFEEEMRRRELVGVAQARFAKISELRTAHFIKEEFERSQQMAHLRGRISEKTYRSMLQDIGVPFIESDTDVKSSTVRKAQQL